MIAFPHTLSDENIREKNPTSSVTKNIHIYNSSLSYHASNYQFQNTIIVFISQM